MGGPSQAWPRPCPSRHGRPWRPGEQAWWVLKNHKQARGAAGGPPHAPSWGPRPRLSSNPRASAPLRRRGKAELGPADHQARLVRCAARVASHAGAKAPSAAQLDDAPISSYAEAGARARAPSSWRAGMAGQASPDQAADRQAVGPHKQARGSAAGAPPQQAAQGTTP